jgi:hypothetical protein
MEYSRAAGPLREPAGVLLESPAPAANARPSTRQSALSRFGVHYVTMARKSCNDSHVGVIQQPEYCVRGKHPEYGDFHLDRRVMRIALATKGGQQSEDLT